MNFIYIYNLEAISGQWLVLDLFFIDTGGSVELNIKRKRNALSEDAKKEKRETEQTKQELTLDKH